MLKKKTKNVFIVEDNPTNPHYWRFFKMLCCMLYKPESLERPQVILQTWLISFSVTSELIQYLSQTENSGDSPIYPQCYPVSKTIQIIYRNPRCAFFFFLSFLIIKRLRGNKITRCATKKIKINLGHIWLNLFHFPMDLIHRKILRKMLTPCLSLHFSYTGIWTHTGQILLNTECCISDTIHHHFRKPEVKRSCSVVSNSLRPHGL